MKTIRQLKAGVEVLKERLKHQRSEVVQAEKRLGEPGYNKWYLSRMRRNCQATENMLKGYQRAINVLSAGSPAVYRENSVKSKNNKIMKSFKRASVLKGAKRTWRGKSKNGNTVHLYTKKGVKGIRAVTYRTKNGPRVMVTTQRVYKLR